jgi:hypothetical protein
MLRNACMSAITKAPKTFNNCLGFERSLWQQKTSYFSSAPKMSVF